LQLHLRHDLVLHQRRKPVYFYLGTDDGPGRRLLGRQGVVQLLAEWRVIDFKQRLAFAHRRALVHQNALQHPRHLRANLHVHDALNGGRVILIGGFGAGMHRLYRQGRGGQGLLRGLLLGAARQQQAAG
jgi:hypothetical protein